MKVVSFIPIKLNNQRLPGKNTMLLNGRPMCDYLFETISNVDSIDEKYIYCSDEAIKPYIAPYEPKGLRFLKRDPYLDGFQVKGLEITSLRILMQIFTFLHMLHNHLLKDLLFPMRWKR